MKKTIFSFLLIALMIQNALPSHFAFASTVSPQLDQEVLLNGKVNLPNGNKKVSVSVQNESIRTLLHDLAVSGGFNLMIDNSVGGNVTIELNNVTLNDAIDSIAEMGNLKIVPQSGNIFLAITRAAAYAKGVERQLSKVIPVYYTNANRIAAVLNSSLLALAPTSSSSTISSSSGFSGSGTGANGSGTSAPGSTANSAASSAPTGSAGSSSSTTIIQKAQADSRTNSVIVVGTAQDIKLAEAFIKKMDVPRQSKTFYLSNANALDVATLLAGSTFNDGSPAFTVGGSSGGASSGGSGGSSSGGSSSGGSGGSSSSVPSAAASLRVEKQDVAEGNGVNDFGATNGNGVSSGLSSSVTLRAMVKSQDSANVSPLNALIIPDTRQNAITIMGTAEQIALAESLIPTFDAQLPQVSIEASLVEITDTKGLEAGTSWGGADGKLQVGFNNKAFSAISGNGLIGIDTQSGADTDNASSAISFNTSPSIKVPNYAFRIRSLLYESKARIIANPTIVATHDTESIISIVDEIVRRVVTTISNGFATQTVEVGEAGIVLDILPKIGEDGTISMRIRPSITSVLKEEKVLGNIVTLLTKRDLLSQNVRLKDGETLVIGGLIQDTNSTQMDKLPVGGDLPIVSAMFRASQRSGKRSELVLMITPHIINNTKLVPPVTFNQANEAMVPSSWSGGK